MQGRFFLPPPRAVRENRPRRTRGKLLSHAASAWWSKTTSVNSRRESRSGEPAQRRGWFETIANYHRQRQQSPTDPWPVVSQRYTWFSSTSSEVLLKTAGTFPQAIYAG